MFTSYVKVHIITRTWVSDVISTPASTPFHDLLARVENECTGYTFSDTPLLSSCPRQQYHSILGMNLTILSPAPALLVPVCGMEDRRSVLHRQALHVRRRPGRPHLRALGEARLHTGMACIAERQHPPHHHHESLTPSRAD